MKLILTLCLTLVTACCSGQVPNTYAYLGKTKEWVIDTLTKQFPYLKEEGQIVTYRGNKWPDEKFSGGPISSEGGYSLLYIECNLPYYVQNDNRQYFATHIYLFFDEVYHQLWYSNIYKHWEKALVFRDGSKIKPFKIDTSYCAVYSMRITGKFSANEAKYINKKLLEANPHIPEQMYNDNIYKYIFDQYNVRMMNTGKECKLRTKRSKRGNYRIDPCNKHEWYVTYLLKSMGMAL